MLTRRVRSAAFMASLLVGACHSDKVSTVTPPPPVPPPPPPVRYFPVVALAHGLTTRAGDSATVAMTLSDSAGLRGAPWQYSVAWGDGTNASGTLDSTGPLSLFHLYHGQGQFTIHATLVDAGNVSTTDSSAISVGAPVVLSGAGDIGTCGVPYAAQTAAILDTLPGTIFTAGDNAYPHGSAADFANCYDPTWGRHKARTNPTPGNHEYETPNATGYYAYFGAAAGDPATGYYSYDLGDWHIVVLNSTLTLGPLQREEAWLGADLRSHPAKCTLAMWHHPLFTSSVMEPMGTMMTGFWDSLSAAGAEVVINGHLHNYERFAPQTSAGVADPMGPREFLVGTGGASLDRFDTPVANSEARIEEHGVLELTLHKSSYSWQFIPVTPGAQSDSGTTACH